MSIAPEVMQKILAERQREGLSTASIEIDGFDNELCESKERKPELSYELTDFPSAANIGQEFEVKLKLSNNGDEDHRAIVWSYVYKGSVSYSGIRESNQQEMTLKPHSSAVILLKNRVDDAEQGKYNLKVKVLKDDLKNPYELTEEIALVGRAVKINKFYTLAENTDDEINLFASIENKNDYSNQVTIAIQSFFESFEHNVSMEKNEKATLKIPVQITKGNNLFFL